MSTDTANAVWSLWLLVGTVTFAIFETVALVSRRAGDTLSERTRVWFGTNTARGRWAFGTLWAGFAMWFLWHILAG